MTSAQTRSSRLLHWAEENIEDALMALRDDDPATARERLIDAVHNIDRSSETDDGF